jgi:hypothetical protein
MITSPALEGHAVADRRHDRVDGQGQEGNARDLAEELAALAARRTAA